MKFYIFGGVYPVLDLYIKDNIYKSNEFNTTLERFNELCDSLKFNHLYLVVDFEKTKQKFFDVAQIDDTQVPFLTIGEYHYDDLNPEKTIRTDTVVLETKGFSEEFHNNQLMITRFEYYLNNKIPCNLIVRYINYDIENGAYFDIQCPKISTVDLLQMKKPIPLKKIKLQPVTWKANPRKRERKFFNYNMKEEFARAN